MTRRNVLLGVSLLAAVSLLAGNKDSSCDPTPTEPVCTNSADCGPGAYCDAGECVECEPVYCTLYCPYGFATDADGCEICACAPPPRHDFCEIPEDCACGVDADTGQCAFGNRFHIDTSQQCPDFCAGVRGNLTITCVEGHCVQQSDLPAECANGAVCRRTGCSGQVCAPGPVATTCEWRPEYACYGEEYTFCGCFAGQCAFARTDAFAACLADPPGAF